MPKEKIFSQHIEHITSQINTTLSKLDFEGAVIYSGDLQYFYLDDQAQTFRANPHFLRWCYINNPFSFIKIIVGEKPTLLFHKPEDFWHEGEDIFAQGDWSSFNISIHKEKTDFPFTELKGKKIAYIGTDRPEAKDYSFYMNPKNLLFAMDWFRTQKTDYEKECLLRATEIGAKGHKGALKAFSKGATEQQIHLSFLEGINGTEDDLPYRSIIGLDSKGAILHYQKKRNTPSPGQSLLIDAGASYRGYGSDITRTYVKKEAHNTFQNLVVALDKSQQKICKQVKVGRSFADLHLLAHEETAKILLDSNILLGCSMDEAITWGITKTFCPHGLGHHLGIQVHDVGGHQINERGDKPNPSKKFPNLRLTRDLREDEVITIEPGIYFIPMLLEKERQGPHSSKINWDLVDLLTPLGGIRIEDNLIVQKGSSRNMTREFLPSSSYII